jgi:outer membrane protein assembly factor BamA
MAKANAGRRKLSRSGRAIRFDPFGVFVTLASLTLLSAIPSAVDAQLRGPEVKGVTFEGNETFPGDSLARAIVTRETACRSWVFYFPIPFCPLGIDFSLSRSQLRNRDLPRDRARLTLWYRQRGFREVLVDTAVVTRAGPNAEVMFRVVEGPPVIADSIEFVGADDYDGEGLLVDLPIRPGDRLSTLELDATRDTLARRLTDDGHAYAEVYLSAFRPAEDRYNAIVTFEIVVGPRTTYGDITVSGTDDLSVGTVLRTAQLTTGDPYRRSEIEEATRRLYGLEIIRNASVVPDTAALDRDPSVDLEISLQEGDPYRVRAGGGWNSAECLNVEARWTARNFAGGGRLLQVRGRVGNLLASVASEPMCPQSGSDEKFTRLTGLASVDFVQPRIFSTRNALTASIYAERQSLPDVFVRRAVGAQVGLSRTISPQTQLTGFYRPELSELDADNVLYCTGFLVCNPDDIVELEGAIWLSPVGLNLTRDRSNDILNPRAGYRVLLDLEHAAPWTASDFRYDRIVAEASRYIPVSSSVFAMRVRGGWVGPGGFEGLVAAGGETPDIVHPQKRFYTGGANSVRGFAQSRLGPRVLFADPQILLSDTEGLGGMCSAADLIANPVTRGITCVPHPDALMNPQPTGGTRLIELNVELRFPIAGSVEGVLFTDAGQAWAAQESISLSSMEFAPGVGVRVPSPVGPIRIDVAYRFRDAEELNAVTETIRLYVAGQDQETARLVVDGMTTSYVSTGQLVFLPNPFLFGVNDRGLQLHVSIGQAF